MSTVVLDMILFGLGHLEKFIEEEEKDKLDKMSEDEVQHLGYNGNLLILPSFITSCNIAS